MIELCATEMRAAGPPDFYEQKITAEPGVAFVAVADGPLEPVQGFLRVSDDGRKFRNHRCRPEDQSAIF